MKNAKRLVVIGGGHGQSTILRGLKEIKNIHISTIVTVADDGGSTGRLRRHFHIPAMGDVRNVMIALSKEEPLLAKLMDYRFDDLDGEDVGGHNLGNLILTALTQQTGNFMEAISDISKVLNVAGDIIPATTQVVTLFARMEDGTIVAGESNIPEYDNRIEEVFYNTEVHATESAVEAIEKADMIIFGIGSIYTSILPNIIIDEIREAILKSDATRIYICNAMTQHGETDGYSLEDHVQAIEKHLRGLVDLVIFAQDEIPESALKNYEEELAFPVMIREKDHTYKIFSTDLLSFQNDLIRHVPSKIQFAIEKLINEEF